MTVLATEHLSIAFGGVHALEDVNLAVAPGLVFSIIGPNGAGKTTLFNIISGLYLAQQGRVRLAGEDVSSLAPEELARRGLARTFQCGLWPRQRNQLRCRPHAGEHESRPEL